MSHCIKIGLLELLNSVRLVLKCGLAHLNANARDESNAHAQQLNQMQMHLNQHLSTSMNSVWLIHCLKSKIAKMKLTGGFFLLFLISNYCHHSSVLPEADE